MSSTNFTVPRGVKKIDCFCVGGGGAGGSWYRDTYAFGFNLDGGCGGGGGGFTSTVLGASVNPGDEIAIIVGAGGVCDIPETYSNLKLANDGGSSSVVDICSADGGCRGKSGFSDTGGDFSYGGSGGSIETSWSNYYTLADSFTVSALSGRDGGSDGGDAKHKTAVSSSNNGKGQGTTTRYFGESNGTLYAGGGAGSTMGMFIKTSNSNSWGITEGVGGAGGGGNSFQIGQANTGGGGGGGDITYEISGPIYSQFYKSSNFGGYTYYLFNPCSHGNAGGSGICIIRWDDQKS